MSAIVTIRGGIGRVIFASFGVWSALLLLLVPVRALAVFPLAVPVINGLRFGYPLAAGLAARIAPLARGYGAPNNVGAAAASMLVVGSVGLMGANGELGRIRPGLTGPEEAAVPTQFPATREKTPESTIFRAQQGTFSTPWYTSGNLACADPGVATRLASTGFAPPRYTPSGTAVSCGGSPHGCCGYLDAQAGNPKQVFASGIQVAIGNGCATGMGWTSAGNGICERFVCPQGATLQGGVCFGNLYPSNGIPTGVISGGGVIPDPLDPDPWPQPGWGATFPFETIGRDEWGNEVRIRFDVDGQQGLGVTTGVQFSGGGNTGTQWNHIRIQPNGTASPPITQTTTGLPSAQPIPNFGSAPTGTPTTNPNADPAPGGSPKAPIELVTCGLPGEPACKIDETGTSTVQQGQAAVQQQKDALDTAAQTRIDTLGQVTTAEGKNTGWGLVFPIVQTCEPMPLWAGKTADLCAYAPYINVLTSMIWAAAAFFGCTGMISTAIRSRA